MDDWFNCHYSELMPDIIYCVRIYFTIYKLALWRNVYVCFSDMKYNH